MLGGLDKLERMSAIAAALNTSRKTTVRAVREFIQTEYPSQESKARSRFGGIFLKFL